MMALWRFESTTLSVSRLYPASAASVPKAHCPSTPRAPGCQTAMIVSNLGSTISFNIQPP